MVPGFSWGGRIGENRRVSIFRVSNERGDLHAVALELDGVEPPSLDEVDGTVGTEPNLPQVLWNRFFSNILHLEDFTRVDPMGLCLFSVWNWNWFPVQELTRVRRGFAGAHGVGPVESVGKPTNGSGWTSTTVDAFSDVLLQFFGSTRCGVNQTRWWGGMASPTESLFLFDQPHHARSAWCPGST